MTPRGLLAALAVGTVVSLGTAALAQGDAGSEQRIEAVAALARLNGVALYCRHLDQVQDIKTAVTANVPPLPVYGATFEENTDKGFLSVAGGREDCPERGALAENIAGAIAEVEAVFAAP